MRFDTLIQIGCGTKLHLPIRALLVPYIMRCLKGGFTSHTLLGLLLHCMGTSALSLLERSVRTLDILYPKASYLDRKVSARNAALSTGGRSEDGIPLAGHGLVYGEFDLSFFSRLLDAAGPLEGDTFVDLGSGVGRLVLAAALLHPDSWISCHGIELLPELHNAAIDARLQLDNLPPPHCSIPLAPCEYSVLDVYGTGAAAALGNADVCFSYSVTWERDEQGRLTELSHLLANRLKVIRLFASVIF